MTWSCQEKIDLDTHIDIQIGSEVESVHVDALLEYDEIMPLNRSLSAGAQGGDCWGDYFFQFVADNSRVRVFDLSKKQLVQTIYIPSSQRGFVPNCHCNTVCFGTEYYDTEDSFPLIYVSTGYADDNEYTGALVYRLTENNGVFSISLVQTVRFPLSITSWTEFVPAGDYGYLCYTRRRIIYKVNMPKLKEGDIIIGPKDALKSYQFTPQPEWMSSSRNQDRVFYQGKIAYISGVPQAGEASALVFLNLDNLEREKIYDLKKNGLTNESESIFVWQGSLCIAFVDRIIKLKI